MRHVGARGIQRLLTIAGLLAFVATVAAQSGPATQWPATPFKPNPNLSAQERSGEHLFLQRCSICHLAAYSKASPTGWPNKAPSLEGVLQGAGPDKETAVREATLKGSLNMPGFQYALEPSDLDALIAYLKTL